MRRQKSVLGTVRPRGNSPFAGAGKGYRRGAIYQKLDSYLSGYQAETTKPESGRRKEFLTAADKENTRDLSQGNVSPTPKLGKF